MKILVPVDFSDCSKRAAHFALEMSVTLKAKVQLLHVLSIPHLDPHMPPEMAERMLQENEQKAHEQYQSFRAELDKTNRKATTFEVRQGFFLAELEAHIDEYNPDYVVMGTQGATGVKKLVGSNTSNAIERLRIPVLAVPEEAQYQQPKHLLYCTDLAADDYQYIDQLLQLADDFQATITCLHVCQSQEQLDEVQVEDLKEFFWKEIQREQLHIDIMYHKNLDEAIDNYAREHAVDWLAMLTHRRTLLERIFHKSVTKKMAVHTHLPLLAFHK